MPNYYSDAAHHAACAVDLLDLANNPPVRSGYIEQDTRLAAANVHAGLANYYVALADASVRDALATLAED